MLNESQLTDIRNYLLTKKLPIDILLEVQDHFISQISSIQQEENLEFEAAFAKVKESWRKELTLSWKGEISLMDSTDFMRKMRKQIQWANFKSAMLLSLPYVLLLFIVANFMSAKLFHIFFLGSIFIPILWAIFNYIKHYKDFKLPKVYTNNIITLHQDGILLFVVILSPFFNMINFDDEKAIYFQKLFLLQILNIESWRLIVLFLMLVMVIGGIAYSIICQKNYLRQIQIVKPFLKYLQKTA